jgi:hypothetical protein
MPDTDGREFMATWSHFDYGKRKPPEDIIYRYDLEPLNRLERTQVQTGRDAQGLRQRLCLVQDSGSGLARGQDSPLCQQFVEARQERKPVTTPPANNHGQSFPPGARH